MQQIYAKAKYEIDKLLLKHDADPKVRVKKLQMHYWMLQRKEIYHGFINTTRVSESSTTAQQVILPKPKSSEDLVDIELFKLNHL